MKSKALLRQEMIALRNALAADVKEAYDKQICEQLYALIQQINARTIHTYLPMGSEINIYPLLKQLLLDGITLVAPEALKARQMNHRTIFSLTSFHQGIYGTRFPDSGVLYTGTYDLIIVPGLAFDQRKYRLGYGAGYYDLFLKEHDESYKTGVAYAFQLFPEIPVEAHDHPLDAVIATG